MILAPSESIPFTAETVLTANPSPALASRWMSRSAPSLEASMSTSAAVKSVPVKVALADTPQSPREVEAFPQMFFGREAMSVVGRAEASIPYSMSRSPEVVDADQERDGSSPPRSAKFPSCTLIYKRREMCLCEKTCFKKRKRDFDNGR